MVRREKWPLAACGHRHEPVEDRFGFGARAAGIYRLAAPFSSRTVWGEVGKPEHVTIEPGSLVRCDAWVGIYDAYSDICWDGYRCHVLTGLQAELCVLVEDAGTPDVEPPGDWHGDRPTLGLPPVFVREPAGGTDPGLTNRSCRTSADRPSDSASPSGVRP